MANGNGTDQVSAPANKLKAALGRIITFILSRDWASSIKNFMGGVGRISVALVVSLAPIGLAYLFLRPKSESPKGPVIQAMDWLKRFLLGTSPKGSEKPAIDIFNWLVRLPTEPAFYYSIAAFVGAYLGWRWWLYAKLLKEIETKKEGENQSSLTPRDWWVVQGLRGRAHIFRTLAGVLLSGVVAVLLGGVYLVLFVLPPVLESDRFQAQNVQRANFKQQFDSRLQFISEGRYWFKVADVGLDISISEEGSSSDLLRITNTLLVEKAFAQLVGMALPPGMTLPRLPVLNTNEVSKNEVTIFAIGHGKALVTRDGGKTWSVPEGLKLEEGEPIIAAAFSADGQSGVVAGNDGSVFVTHDGGENWSVPEGLKLREGEQIIATEFDADGQFGVVAGNEGSVFVTQNGGENWRVPEGLKLKEGEQIIATMFDADGQSGVVAGDEGSVFVTQDGGRIWRDSDGLKLNESEWIVAAAFSTGSKHGVVTGGEGSVFATQSSGRSWISTKRDYQGTIFIDVVSALPRGRNFVAMDDDGGIYLLKAYPDMAEWEERSLDTMRIYIQEDKILRKSVIGREITKFLDSVLSADVNVDDGEASKTGNDKALFSHLFDELTVMRVVTLIVLLFLVQILVRLHQYNLRLAVFWDARADAVLLARSFADHSAKTFDDLVTALAPDAYDFKPPPKS